MSEQYEFVIGADTHAATYTFALVAAATGALLARAEFATSPAGLSRAQGWLQSTQNTALSQTDLTSTSLSSPIDTMAASRSCPSSSSTSPPSRPTG